MPRNIPLSFRQVAEQNYSDEVDLCFVTITHPTLQEPIRVVWDTKDYIFNGDYFIGFPFDITILSDDDQPPKAQLTIQNVDRVIGEAIRDLRSPPRVRIELLSSADFFTASNPAWASKVVFYEGFESSSEAGLGGSSLGSIMFDTDFAKHGDVSMNFPTSGQPSYRETTTGHDITHGVLSFDFYVSALSPTDFVQFAGFQGAGDTDVTEFYLGDNGSISTVLNGVPIGGTDFQLSPGRWYHFDIRQYAHATEGEIEIFINGNQVKYFDDLNTAFAGNIDAGLFGFVDSGNVDAWFDEVQLLSLDQRWYFADFETGDGSQLGGTSAGTFVVTGRAAFHGGYGLLFDNRFPLLGFMSGGAASITNPLNATGAIDVEVGDLVVAVIGQQTALNTTGVTDNLGNTYTPQNAGTDAGTATGRMFYARVTTRGTLTTVSFASTASANDASCCVAVFQGPFSTTPIDLNPANRSNDTSNPLQGNAPGSPSITRELHVAWFAGANGTAGLDTSGDDLTLAVSQRQSAAIETAISYMWITDGTAQTPGFSTPGTIGNNVIGNATFRGTGDSPYVESTTGLNLSEAILKFYIFYFGNVPDPGGSICGFADTSDNGIAYVSILPDLTLYIYDAIADDAYESNFILEPFVWHEIEFRAVIDGGEGEYELRVDGNTVVKKTGLTNNSSGDIDRAFLDPKLDNDGGAFYAYDDFEVINLGDISPTTVYYADTLFLQNVKVDALQITADIVGWDYLQRVWPSARADQTSFPGLFR